MDLLGYRRWSQRVLHYLFHKDRLRELLLLSMENTRFWEDLAGVFQYLKEVYKKGGCLLHGQIVIRQGGIVFS